MGRKPCCSKEDLNRGDWTAEEDRILRAYIKTHGEGKWRSLPNKAGLKRCGKSCRLRWLNYLRPDIKRGNISHDEEDLILRLHKLLGNRWSLIAGRLPGRTDNEIKNYWNTILRKKLQPKIGSAEVGETSLVRTKAMRWSNMIVTPQHHNILNADDQNPAVEPVVISNSIVEKASEDKSYESLACAAHDENWWDLLMDLEMRDASISDDAFNLDFVQLCGTEFPCNDKITREDFKGINLVSSLDHSTLLNEVLFERVVSDPTQPHMELDLESLTNFLNCEEEWK